MTPEPPANGCRVTLDAEDLAALLCETAGINHTAGDGIVRVYDLGTEWAFDVAPRLAVFALPDGEARFEYRALNHTVVYTDKADALVFGKVVEDGDNATVLLCVKDKDDDGIEFDRPLAALSLKVKR